MRRQHNGIEEGELIRKLLISSGVNKDNIQVVDKEFKIPLKIIDMFLRSILIKIRI